MSSPPKSRHPLTALRRRFPAGLPIDEMQAILERDYKDPISVATIRKYVQQGLVEKSTRRGMGRRHGSKGYYPVTALVQLVRVREYVRTSGLPASLSRQMMEVHRHLDAMRESLENALSGLIVITRQERRASAVKPQLVRLRAVIADALDELSDLAQPSVDAEEEATL